MSFDFSYLQNKTVVVTGASGFIGSHLSDRLIALGAKVIGVDNFITGRKENIAHLNENTQFQFIEADVNQAPESYLPKHLSIDLVLHFASPASPPRYQAHPVETYLVNSHATHQLLDYLKNNYPQARFLFASTSEVYGDPLEHPQKESYWGNVNSFGPRACYDESKRLGESICWVFGNEFDLDVRLVRIFNTYGPRMDPADGRVIPNLALQALKGEAMTIYGDGSQTRSYCYVEDLVEGILRLAVHPEGKGQVVNLGNPDEFTVSNTSEVMYKVGQELGFFNQPLIINHQPLPKDDPTRRQPDISKAKELLGWEPTIKFEEGLKKTLEYFKQYA